MRGGVEVMTAWQELLFPCRRARQSRRFVLWTTHSILYDREDEVLQVAKTTSSYAPIW